jgi:hypothetical protein
MPSNDHKPDEVKLGPADFRAVDFPGGRVTAPGFGQLLSLAPQGTVSAGHG